MYYYNYTITFGFCIYCYRGDYLMNGNYYQNPTFPTLGNTNEANSFEEGYQSGQLADMPMQQSYIENRFFRFAVIIVLC